MAVVKDGKANGRVGPDTILHVDELMVLSGSNKDLDRFQYSTGFLTSFFTYIDLPHILGPIRNTDFLSRIPSRSMQRFIYSFTISPLQNHYMMKNEFYKVDIQAKYTITNSLSKNINQYWKSDIAVSKEKNFLDIAS